MDRGRVNEALAQYQEAVAIYPDFAEAHYNFGNALAESGQFDAAVAHYRKVLELYPDLAEVRNDLGNVLTACGRINEAVAEYQKALKIQPNFAEAHYNFGLALAKGGRPDEAVTEYYRAVELKPQWPGPLRSRRCFGPAGQNVGSTCPTAQSDRLRPDDVAILNDTAWLLATNPDASVRNGAASCGTGPAGGKTHRRPSTGDPRHAGRRLCRGRAVSEAVGAAERAIALASARGDNEAVNAFRERLKLYRAGSPYRDIPPSLRK